MRSAGTDHIYIYIWDINTIMTKGGSRSRIYGGRTEFHEPFGREGNAEDKRYKELFHDFHVMINGDIFTKMRLTVQFTL